MSKQTNKVATVKTMSDLVNLGQDGIPGMLEVVKKKISSLSSKAPDALPTKGKELPGFGDLKDITSVTVLIQAHSSVVNKAAAYKRSADDMNISLKKYPFKLEGCTESDWVAAIENTVSELTNKKELEKLRQVQKTLEENLSQEAKLKNDLAKIGNLLLDDSEVE